VVEVGRASRPELRKSSCFSSTRRCNASMHVTASVVRICQITTATVILMQMSHLLDGFKLTSGLAERVYATASQRTPDDQSRTSG
jgi:hypothetical protein